MFQWYKAAEVCLVYLSDVSDPSPSDLTDQSGSSIRTSFQAFLPRFLKSSWFTRGWTLQELLAPKRVLFFSEAWTLIGSKCNVASGSKDDGMGYTHELSEDISGAIGIPTNVITHEQPLEDVSVAERMSWLSHRSTTRIEDMAYCVMGLFGINMPLLYGEGEGAFQRLQEEIIRASNDESIFAWYHPPGSPLQRPILASKVTDFHLCGKIKTGTPYRRLPHSITNQGLQLCLEKDSAIFIREPGSERVVVSLNCSSPGYSIQYHPFNSLMLEQQPCGHYDRVRADFAELRRLLDSRQPGYDIVRLEEDRTIHVHTTSVRQACLRATARAAEVKAVNITRGYVQSSVGRPTRLNNRGPVALGGEASHSLLPLSSRTPPLIKDMPTPTTNAIRFGPRPYLEQDGLTIAEHFVDANLLPYDAAEEQSPISDDRGPAVLEGGTPHSPLHLRSRTPPLITDMPTRTTDAMNLGPVSYVDQDEWTAAQQFVDADLLLYDAAEAQLPLSDADFQDLMERWMAVQAEEELWISPSPLDNADSPSLILTPTDAIDPDVPRPESSISDSPDLDSPMSDSPEQAPRREGFHCQY